MLGKEKEKGRTGLDNGITKGFIIWASLHRCLSSWFHAGEQHWGIEFWGLGGNMGSPFQASKPECRSATRDLCYYLMNDCPWAVHTNIKQLHLSYLGDKMCELTLRWRWIPSKALWEEFQEMHVDCYPDRLKTNLRCILSERWQNHSIHIAFIQIVI